MVGLGRKMAWLGFALADFFWQVCFATLVEYMQQIPIKKTFLLDKTLSIQEKSNGHIFFSIQVMANRWTADIFFFLNEEANTFFSMIALVARIHTYGDIYRQKIESILSNIFHY